MENKNNKKTEARQGVGKTSTVNPTTSLCLDFHNQKVVGMRKVRTKRTRQRIFFHLWCNKKLLDEVTTEKKTIDIELDNKMYQVSANGESDFYIYEY